MSFFDKLQIKTRLSWGKRTSGKSSTRSSTCTSSSFSSSSKQSKKSVRFNLCPEIIDCDYVITERLQKDLWYRPTDLATIKFDIAQHVRKVVTGDYSDCTPADEIHSYCHRGLEARIRDGSMQYSSTSTTKTRRESHAAILRGLLILQQRQRAQGLVDEEELRRYCEEKTSRLQTRAELLAARDALNALRIYEESDHWKMPLRDTKSENRQHQPPPLLPLPNDSMQQEGRVILPHKQILRRPAAPPRTNSSRAA